MASTERLLRDLSQTHAILLSDEELFASGWDQIEEMGLPLALIGEEQGGPGLDEAVAFELIRMCGRQIVPYPVVETMLANRFTAAEGGAVAGSPVTSLGQLTPAQQELAALARAMQMAGALETILAMTIAHVENRRQFGRPIAQFQVVQHSLSIMAGEVAAATVAADHAVRKLAEGGADLTLAVGIARARIGEACSKVAALAHQLHGAIGYTREHRLHLFTTALWKWRDEFGTQASWTRFVGQRVLANESGDFWSMVTLA